MAVLSSLSRNLLTNSRNVGILLKTEPNVINSKVINVLQVRHGGGHGPEHMHITPSRFQWHKFKTMTHYYVLVGAIPVVIVVLYSNLFIGPAKLAPTPEDYVPKNYEYYRHPISRFIARYIKPNPQQEYEKMCHYLHEQNEMAMMRKLETRIKEKMAERKDYFAYYVRAPVTKYAKISKESMIETESHQGD